jgi:hypothetical protein
MAKSVASASSLAGHGAVLERPAGVEPQLGLESSLDDQCGNDDQAAIPQAQFVVVPCVRRGVNGLCGEAIAEHCRT